MADLKIFLILLFATETIAIFPVGSYYFKMKEVNGSDMYEHLKKSHIIKICNHRVEICSSNDTRVCTMRYVGDIDEYKHFNNSCYLFLSNMCDYPGKEYHIIDDGPCDVHESARRFTVQRRTNVTATNPTTTGNSSNATILFNSTDTSGNATYNKNLEYNGTTPSSEFFLRGRTTTRIPLKYDLEEAFDYHKCPYSCPNFYSPICIIVNRGEGKYFKYFTFVNHCYGDMYYCKNYPEFAAAPELEYESVYASPLGWSYCGSQRYIQFARFSEVLSAMGHFGWLAGDHKYSHIMAPHERIPGFG